MRSQKGQTGLDAQRTILIPELIEKYYNFTAMIPSLQILDFNSKGILQLYPLWNPIIIIGGKEKITLPKLTCVMKCLSSHSQPLVNLVVEGTAKTTNQRKPHRNYCNPVRNRRRRQAVLPQQPSTFCDSRKAQT